MNRFVFLFCLSSLLISSNLLATADFQCVTSVPTTTVITKKEQSTVNFNIIHHVGTQYAPIHSGLLTLSDIESVQRKGKLLAMMGENISLTFNSEKCKIHQDLNYSCFSDEKQTIGGLKVHNFGFQTYSSESFLYSSIFQEFHFSFYVRTAEGENLRMNMVYDLNSSECSF